MFAGIDGPTEYTHTQAGYLTVGLLAAAILVLVVQMLHQFAWPGLVVLGILVAVGVCFCCMSIKVKDGQVRWSLGAGLLRWKVRISDIESVEAVRNRWYYGWGIRCTPHGWLYNVSGLDAVQIRLWTGKVFRLGTDQPDQLVQAIRAQMSRQDRTSV